MIGVYILRQDSQVVYVGASLDIHRRITQHEASKKVFNSHEYIECLAEDMEGLEIPLIKKHDPIYNYRHAPTISPEYYECKDDPARLHDTIRVSPYTKKRLEVVKTLRHFHSYNELLDYFIEKELNNEHN